MLGHGKHGVRPLKHHRAPQAGISSSFLFSADASCHAMMSELRVKDSTTGDDRTQYSVGRGWTGSSGSSGASRT